MAHFAEIDHNNIVARVVTVNNDTIKDEYGIERESIGQDFLYKLIGGKWVQTSFNGSFRKMFAARDFGWFPEQDIFLPPGITSVEQYEQELERQKQVSLQIQQGNLSSEMPPLSNEMKEK